MRLSPTPQRLPLSWQGNNPRCVQPCIPKRREGSRLLRLVARFSLRVREVPGSIPGTAPWQRVQPSSTEGGTKDRAMSRPRRSPTGCLVQWRDSRSGCERSRAQSPEQPNEPSQVALKVEARGGPLIAQDDPQLVAWSSGVNLASGARSPGGGSRSSPTANPRGKRFSVLPQGACKDVPRPGIKPGTVRSSV